MTHFHERLKWLVEQVSKEAGRKVSLEEFGQVIGFTKSYMSRLVRGKSKAPPDNSEFWARVVNRFGVNLEWLREGKGSRLRYQETYPLHKQPVIEVRETYSTEEPSLQERMPVGNIKPLSQLLPRYIPVASWASAGQARNFEELEEFIDEKVVSDVKDAKAFALIIQGESMQPKFNEGDVIIISPSAPLRNGGLVVARLKGDEGVLFKVYHRRGDTVTLASYNAAFPPAIYQADELSYVYAVVSSVRRH